MLNWPILTYIGVVILVVALFVDPSWRDDLASWLVHPALLMVIILALVIGIPRPRR